MKDNEKKVDEQTVENTEATSVETSDKAVENTQSEVEAGGCEQTAGEKKKSFLDFFKKKKTPAFTGVFGGVPRGTRTLDLQIHNLAR